MASNDGHSFEKLVADTYQVLTLGQNSSISLNELVDGPDGKREFDVVIRSMAADIEIKTAIECKDHKAKCDVKIIDGFASKIIDTNINKGMIISRNGFTRSARNKAKRLGISLYTLDTIKEFVDELDNMKPHVLIRIQVAKLEMTSTIKRSNSIQDEHFEFVIDPTTLATIAEKTVEKIRTSEICGEAITDFKIGFSVPDIEFPSGTKIKSPFFTITPNIEKFTGYANINGRHVERVEVESNTKIQIALDPDFNSVIAQLKQSDVHELPAELIGTDLYYTALIEGTKQKPNLKSIMFSIMSSGQIGVQFIAN